MAKRGGAEEMAVVEEEEEGKNLCALHVLDRACSFTYIKYAYVSL